MDADQRDFFGAVGSGFAKGFRYTLFSVDDSRETLKREIRRNLSEWTEIEGLTVDGREPATLAAAMERFPYKINWSSDEPVKVGQLGIWYGVLSALEHAPIMTIEDDAVIGPMFHRSLCKRLWSTPRDLDFFSLFLARDSDHMFDPNKAVNELVTPIYGRYGGVSMIYTKQGADKIRALLERDGITGQYDDSLYYYAKAGELNGYCSRPDKSDLVYILGGDSIVQESNYLEKRVF